MGLTSDSIFSITNDSGFETAALLVFNHQYRHNQIYRSFCNHLRVSPQQVRTLKAIPYLPISFFKTKKVVSTTEAPKAIFTSSGTTGASTSKHYVSDLSLYEKSYLRAFERFYGDIKDYCILALLPSYLEREGSSLIYMANDLIKKSGNKKSGFYLNDLDKLILTLKRLEAANTPTILLGVSFALLDLAENHTLNLGNTIVMETGGMKGRRKEIIRTELHKLLKKGLGVSEIHSEYGMTELLSQAYSLGDGRFHCPPWMRVSTRDTEDPLTPQQFEKTGGINIIDLANYNSCSFIATQDLGKSYADGSFEILGRFDNAEVRGCNLMVL